MTKKKAKQKQFIEVYKKSVFNVSAACKKLKITRACYYKWLKEKRFAAQVSDAKEELIDFVETKLIQQVNNNNLGAICFYLKCQGKQRGYIEKLQVGINPDDTKPKPIKIEIVAEDGRIHKNN